MVSLHLWDSNSIFTQHDFNTEKELVEWIVQNKVMFKVKNFSLKDEQEILKNEFIEHLNKYDIDIVLDIWDVKEDEEFMTMEDIRKLLKKKAVKVYFTNDFVYEYYSIHQDK